MTANLSLRRKLLAIHTIAGLRADHGGTSRSVPALCRSLIAQAVDVALVAGAPAAEHSSFARQDAPWIHWAAESTTARQWGVPQQFRRHLDALTADFSGDCIVHDHGVWLATNHAVAAYAARHRLPRIVSPRGMLSPWAMRHGGLKKRAAWGLYQRRDLASAAAFHATSEQEAAELRALGFSQPAAVIPNGIDLPVEMPPKGSRDGSRMMLFLSRIHPKKGVLNLLQAWHDAAPPAPWRLVIAGPDEGGHRAEAEALTHRLGVAARVTFPGEIADAEKWRWYAEAEAFILPSFSENFGIVVAEALAAGTPVIATTGTPWRKLPELGFGWQVDPTAAGLAQAIREATDLSSSELQVKGAQGAAWATREFSWQQAAQEMKQVYQWMLGGEAPGCLYES